MSPAPPFDVGIIDTMIGFPVGDMKKLYSFITKQTKDRQSKEDFEFPVEYMFKDVPDKKLRDVSDPVGFTLHEMDAWGIEKGLIGVGSDDAARALRDHPDRFVASTGVDPNDGMEAVRKLVRDYETFGVKALGVFPAGYLPQVPINDKRMYPIYAKCVELDIPAFVCAGIPGPRLKFACQHVELIDEVMFDFPELVFVTRHGCEPWADLAVKLMLKWPNLYFSTSAFAPRYYPKAIIDYANTRGADKVIYAGYFPMGLSVERIMTEMPNVAFKDDVWPKFLRGNAARVLKLDYLDRDVPSTTLTANQLARRRRVLAAVLDLVADGHGDDMQMKDIADRSGVALGTIYRYFSSKDHVLAAALLDWARGLPRPTPLEGVPADRLVATLRRAVRAYQREPAYARLLILVANSSDERASECYRELGAVVYGTLGDALHDIEPERRQRVLDVVGAVWYHSLVEWMNGRSSAAGVTAALENTARLLLPD